MRLGVLFLYSTLNLLIGILGALFIYNIMNGNFVWASWAGGSAITIFMVLLVFLTDQLIKNLGK